VSEPARFAAGDQIAPGYRVIEHLSRNRVLDVYDVWNEERACRCAAKALRPDRRFDLRAQRRLVREGRLLKRLTHPHIVRAYELLLRPSPIVILETLSGETLAHMLARSRRRLPLREIAALGIHLCSAIHYLHGHRFLHLDLKPSNIVSDRGHAKVLDLSIARRPGSLRKPIGSRPYMAPEQCRAGAVSEATDAWGVGAVLYEAATGKRPFEAAKDGAPCPQIAQRAASVRASRRLPAPFVAAVDACLEPDPARRPTVEGLAKSLEPLT
jgi:serine/threonine protein kinase